MKAITGMTIRSAFCRLSFLAKGRSRAPTINQVAGCKKIPLVIIVVFIPFQKSVGEPLPEDDHRETDHESPDGPETIDLVAGEVCLLGPVHGEVVEDHRAQGGEEEPPEESLTFVHIHDDVSHYTPPI